jgi:hypothetical protein
MTETLCTCTSRDCLNAHDCEDKAKFKIWFKGEYSDTLTFADTEQEVIDAIEDLTKSAPEDFPGWQIRNRAAKTTMSAPKFFAQCAA